MAHKTEKEETEFKVPEKTLTLCVNNCGVTGNPATNNMCQNCFTATTTTTGCDTAGAERASKVMKVSKDRSPRSSIDRLDSQPTTTTTSSRLDQSSNEADPPPPTPEKRTVNRCSGCKRKVGLTGFRCRCGELFCSQHRYSDRHDCSYDYKAAAREAIARENPVVKAAKIVRV